MPPRRQPLPGGPYPNAQNICTEGQLTAGVQIGRTWPRPPPGVPENINVGIPAAEHPAIQRSSAECLAVTSHPLRKLSARTVLLWEIDGRYASPNDTPAAVVKALLLVVVRSHLS